MSESLWRLRTLRDVRTGLDVARRQRVRTLNSLSGTEAAISASIDHRHLAAALAADRRRRQTQMESLARSRRKVEVIRSHLKGMVETNRRLMEQRWALFRSGRVDVPAARTPSAPAGARGGPGTGSRKEGTWR
ncbi:MAG: hypothetical protein IRY95_01955 [Clostridia bacterium]|nr:hypothetical protein [Clostridia bacterium]